jgi:hypothetical protein
MTQKPTVVHMYAPPKNLIFNDGAPKSRCGSAGHTSGQLGRCLAVTTNPEHVTCKVCLGLLERPTPEPTSSGNSPMYDAMAQVIEEQNNEIEVLTTRNTELTDVLELVRSHLKDEATWHVLILPSTKQITLGWLIQKVLG